MKSRNSKREKNIKIANVKICYRKANYKYKNDSKMF